MAQVALLVVDGSLVEGLADLPQASVESIAASHAILLTEAASNAILLTVALLLLTVSIARLLLTVSIAWLLLAISIAWLLSVTLLLMTVALLLLAISVTLFLSVIWPSDGTVALLEVLSVAAAIVPSLVEAAEVVPSKTIAGILLPVEEASLVPEEITVAVPLLLLLAIVWRPHARAVATLLLLTVSSALGSCLRMASAVALGLTMMALPAVLVVPSLCCVVVPRVCNDGGNGGGQEKDRERVRHLRRGCGQGQRRRGNGLRGRGRKKNLSG